MFDLCDPGLIPLDTGAVACHTLIPGVVHVVCPRPRLMEVLIGCCSSYIFMMRDQNISWALLLADKFGKLHPSHERCGGHLGYIKNPTEINGLTSNASNFFFLGRPSNWNVLT